MPTTAWWIIPRTRRRPLRQREPRRPQPSAESALRLSVPEVRTSVPEFIPCQPTNAELAARLEQVAAVVPESVTSVSLTGLSANSGSAPAPRSDKPSPKTSDTRSSLVNPRKVTKPSLASRLRVLLAPPLASLMPGPHTVLEWPGDLMPFQEHGVGALIASNRLLLADDMGLGKTLQVIVALRVMFARGAIDSAIIIAPTSILDQWRRELHKWAPELRAIIIRGPATDRSWQWTAPVHVTIISYDTLRSDAGGGAHSPPLRKTWDVVVADEAQRIKNRNATSSAVKGLKRRRSWAVTGTPLENSEEELASIVEFVDQDDLVSEKRYSPGRQLRQRHRELQLRRKKGDVLDDLPPKVITILNIDLPKQQRDSYDRAEREGIIHIRELGTDARIEHVLELIARLKQICNADPKTGQSAKIDDIRQRVETLSQQGSRALVFSQYISVAFGVAAVMEALREFSPLSFTGELSLDERRSVLDRFRADDSHKALVLSLRAGGVGLNLQEASYVFHVDRWWNPAIERQAEDRTHRYGQTVPVHVFKYSCIDTIEERIDAILEQKQELFDELVDDASLDLATALSSDQLFGLFGLEPPRSHRV